jgi:hypothetical protein
MTLLRSSATLLACLWLATAAAAPPAKPPVPDFTNGAKVGEGRDWTLGPTGARGWVYGWRGHTRDSRQILVTAVAKGSPADGLLQAGDVILGIGDKRFDADARMSLGQAIGSAESEPGGGGLSLQRWRDGKEEAVVLRLPVLGAYSPTAPYDCAKSQAIFERGCEAIAARGLEGVSIPNSLNALALLASGKDEYRPAVAAYAREVAKLQLDSMATWHYGFANMFLAEYVLATGDKEVLPGLRRMTMESATGQSRVGTWGHKFAAPNGGLHGYGCMNLPGLNLTISLAIAREAGIEDPALDLAIARAAAFLRWYVDKGAIPYGDHEPWPGHEDNGKCSSGAVLFDLLGDRDAASFFAKMSAAGYEERERGHTGNFFNVLWALPGVARCGPLTTGAYLQEQAWYYDLARGWDGRFAYQGSPVGEEENNNYTKWDCTGAYLLSYALPLRSLTLTGKRPFSTPPLSAAETAEVIAAGRDYISTSAAQRNGERYEGRSREALLAGLANWSPAVRKRSARTLAGMEGDWTPLLLEMIAGQDREARYGAIEAVGFLGPRADAAGPLLRGLLEDDDPWIQSLASKSLATLGPDERKASVGALLKMSTRLNPRDPRRMAQRAASEALFSRRGGVISQSLDGIDRQLLYPAIQSILRNEDAHAREPVGDLYGKLTDDDLAVLLPDVLAAIEKLAPSNEMFADGIRLAGLDLLSRLHVREGMPLCVDVIEPSRWGQGRRLPKCLEYLARYGGHARELVPRLEELRREFAQQHRGGGPNESVIQLDKAIAAIEASTELPTLVSRADFKPRR